ncbi:MAG: tRNA (N6-threonylcarbamoyladenosine(37)-N6)-methyltransferase TrmO, partial [Oscillospiraceae bacterium]|nr:tRNA (N6-threonylcarbamoyladenosine(37)-N6)-methyltransferase TrmO [Oscillospiraceae bacterium]
MAEGVLIYPIADIHTDFTEKFGIPRQSGRAPGLKGKIVFRKQYRNSEALRGIEEFSHLWLLFDFSQAHTESWSPTVRPPRLGGNKRIGVFASRAPYRPNSIGLSCVKLEKVVEDCEDGLCLLVSGVDLLDGTPIYDIKPYIPYADCHPEACGSYADLHAEDQVVVIFPEQLLNKISEEKREGLKQCLKDNPCPQYQKDPSRVYKMAYAGQDIHFTVNNGVLTVCD